MKWISVKDEMPKYDDIVLFACTGATSQYIKMGKHISTDSSGENFRCINNSIIKVTHWMLLPKLPKLQKRDWRK